MSRKGKRRVRQYQAADVIFALDMRTKTQLLLSGREYLPRLTETSGGERRLNPDRDPNVRIMHVQIASDGEFQRLCADVVSAKGTIDEGIAIGGPPVTKPTRPLFGPTPFEGGNLTIGGRDEALTPAQRLRRLGERSRPMEAFSREELNRLIMDSDLLWAFDRDDLDNAAVFFGEETLQRILRSEVSVGLRVSGVRIDWESDQPEDLAASIEAIKGEGSCDWARRSKCGA